MRIDLRNVQYFIQNVMPHKDTWIYKSNRELVCRMSEDRKHVQLYYLEPSGWVDAPSDKMRIILNRDLSNNLTEIPDRKTAEEIGRSLFKSHQDRVARAALAKSRPN